MYQTKLPFIDFMFLHKSLISIQFYVLLYIEQQKNGKAVITEHSVCLSYRFDLVIKRWLLRDDSRWHWWKPQMFSSLKLHSSGIFFLHASVCAWLIWRTWQTIFYQQTHSYHGSFYCSMCQHQCHELHVDPYRLAKPRKQRWGKYEWERERWTEHYSGENPRVLPDVWHREQGFHHPTGHAGEASGLRMTDKVLLSLN